MRALCEIEGGTLHALVRDHLGSVRAEVRVGAGGGAEIHRADYWPFGGEITTTLDSSEGHRFTAHWREYRGEVKGASVLEGLDFMHAREYDWRTARFTAPDPAAAAWNAYAYVLGNPVSFVDPWGLRGVLPNGPEDLPVNVFLADTTETTWERLWTTMPGVPELGLDPRPEYRKVADPYEQNLTASIKAHLDAAVPGIDMGSAEHYCWRCNVGEASGGLGVFVGGFFVSCTSSWITDYRWHADYYVQAIGVGGGLKWSLPVAGSYWDLVDDDNPTGHPLGLTGPVRISSASLAVVTGFGFADVSMGGARSLGPGGVISVAITAYRLYGWSWLIWAEREYAVPTSRPTSLGPPREGAVMVGGY